jgi:flagellar biosynthesis activator protein FlaF
MYQYSYAEVLGDTSAEARERERMALDRAIDLIELAETRGPRSREMVEAMLFVQQLWGIFLEDLASTDNGLPVPLRASLISIGIWILKESDRIKMGMSDNLRGLVEVCEIIRNGLK